MKILITADIHIHDYPHHNIGSNSFRIDQFTRLAERLVEIAQQNDCKKIFIAGDLLEYPKNSPVNINQCKKFIDILKDYFKGENIHYICGNHDLDNKSNLYQERHNPLITLAADCCFMDQQIIEIDGSRIAFSNWRPVQDFSFITEPVDLLIGHLNLFEFNGVSGQEFDNSKYKLGLFGDIHHPITHSDQKSHAVNCPIPNKRGDCQEGSVIIYDTQSQEWQRVLTRSESFKYLRVYKESELVDPDSYTVTLANPQIKQGVNHQQLIDSLNLDKIIAQSLKELDPAIKELYHQVTATIKRETTINLDFKVTDLVIKNFRSIKYLEMAELPPGITLINGENGVGKSSLFMALNFLLLPPQSSKVLVNDQAETMEVAATISYQANNYRIIRGVDNKDKAYLELFINDQAASLGTIKETQQLIKEHLGFLELADLIFRNQGAGYLLEDYNLKERTQLIYRVLGLNYLTDVFNSLKEASQELKELITKNQGRLEQLNEIIATTDPKVIADTTDYPTVFANLKEQLEQLKQQLSACYTKAKQQQDQQQATSLQLTIAQQTKDLNPSELTAQLSATQQQCQELEQTINKSQLNLKEQDYLILDKTTQINKLVELLANKPCISCKRTSNFTPQEKQQQQQELTLLEQQLSQLKEQQAGLKDHLSQATVNYNNLKQQLVKLEQQQQALNNLHYQQQKLDALLLQIALYQPGQEEALNKQFEEVYQTRELHTINREKQQQYQISLTRLQELQQLLQGKLEEFDYYQQLLELFAPSGNITLLIFKEIAQLLTSEKITVKSFKQNRFKEIVPDFTIKLNIGDNNYLEYKQLSGGQKVYCDIYFIIKLFSFLGVAGYLFLDESLGNLDQYNTEEIIQMLSSSTINNSLIITHGDNFIAYDNRYQVTREQSGTLYQLI